MKRRTPGSARAFPRGALRTTGMLVLLCLIGCGAKRETARAAEVLPPESSARVHARPGPVKGEHGPLGLHPLGLGGKRDGLLYVPRSYRPEQPAALMVLLHGSRGNARQMLEVMEPLADAEGFLLLLPESRDTTWDHKMGRHGQDLAFLDQALAHVFARYAVAPERISLAGFSAGASYALSLGILNGDLFPRIIAFSPSFVHATEPRGEPRIFIAHGDKDAALPVEQTGRRIVAELGAAGFEVRYHEFSGGHSVPAEVARVAADWLRETSAAR
jgi:phospholipase/carboxylesterase